MKGLGKYRVMHCVRYNSRAERDHETWIVEELTKGPLGIGTWWHEHQESGYDYKMATKFKELKLAKEYIERLLNGNPRDKVVKTVVSETE